MDRKDLIRRYLDAETTPAQERELAASFAAAPPADEEEQDAGQDDHDDLPPV